MLRSVSGATGRVRTNCVGVGSGGGGGGGSSSLNSLFNGANLGTVFTDTSPNARVLTAGGGAQTRTAVSMYGGSSGYFDGGYLTTPRIASDNSATWTIEFFVYLNSVGTTGVAFDCQSGTDGFQIYVGTAYVTIQAANSIITNPGWSANTWYHVAVVRGATETTVYGNGVKLGGPAGVIYNPSVVTNVRIGCRQSGILPVQGYLQNFRITPNQELYTGATYTIPTLPLSN